MNNNFIILHFGELTLKKKNYNLFFSSLLNNIKQKLNPYKNKVEIIKEYKRLYVSVLDDSITNDLINDLKNILGINSISLGTKVSNDITEIKKTSLLFLEDLKASSTFKVEVKRVNKKFHLTSSELTKELGAHILINNKINLKVDVHNPDFLFKVEIRNNFSLIYYKTIKCYGGFPFGVSGKGTSMISGGIDSPVSSFLAMKKGLNLDFIHFATPPHTTEEAMEKIFKLLKNLKKFTNKKFLKLYVVNFTLLQNELMHITKDSYRITLMRRMFFRIANIIANKNNSKTIVTGESLGQVASQTLESLISSNDVSDLLIIRPLISYDKNEIIKISKEIDTYSTSILPFEDCCSLFVPKQPITKPKIEVALKQENQIMYKELINEIIDKYVVEYSI